MPTQIQLRARVSEQPTPGVELCLAEPAGERELLGISFELDGSFEREGDAWRSVGWRAVPQASETPDGALFTLMLTNLGDAPAAVEPFEIHFRGAATASFCGATAYVVADCHEPWLGLVPLAGSYDPHPADHTVCIARFEQPIGPGMDVRLTWRARWFDSLGHLRSQVLPSWYPNEDVADVGEAIELRFADGVLTSTDVAVVESFPDVALRAQAGLHTVRAIEAKGVTDLRFGWAADEGGLVESALAADPDPGSAAFLLARAAATRSLTDREVDRLDLSIAAGLELSDPLAISAAVAASPLLGAALLSDAESALVALADDADRVPGTYLAAAQLAARLAISGDAPLSTPIRQLWERRDNRSLEGTLICEPQRNAWVLRRLEHSVGWGLPQQGRHVSPQDVALLGWLARSETLGEQSLWASELYAHLRRWNLCRNLTPRQLAWLTW